jgi:hypothetical protein
MIVALFQAQAEIVHFATGSTPSLDLTYARTQRVANVFSVVVGDLSASHSGVSTTTRKIFAAL